MKVSVSVMCADLARLRDQIEVLNDFTDSYHFDIMDGHYVPNITLSLDVLRSIRPLTKRPIHAHLMVAKPEQYVEDLINAGADMISFHLDTITNQAFRLVNLAKDANVKVGVVLNPLERPESLEYLFPVIDGVTVMTVDPGFAGQRFIPQMYRKISRLQEIKRQNDYNYEIEIDGGVNIGTLKSLMDAGGEVFILGTSGLFGLDEDIEQAIEQAKAYIPFK